MLERQSFGSIVPVAGRTVYAHELIEAIVAPHPSDAVIVQRLTTPFERPSVLELRTDSSFAAYNHDTMRDEALPLAFLNGIAVADGPLQSHSPTMFRLPARPASRSTANRASS